MFSKRQLPALPTCSPSKRLRHNLVDLFLSNDVSGARADSLLRDAVAADSKHISDLVSKHPAKKHIGNSHRDLLRRLKKPQLVGLLCSMLKFEHGTQKDQGWFPPRLQCICPMKFWDVC